MDYIIEYQVAADKVAEQEQAVREFIDVIKAENDPGYRSTSFKREDGTSLVHHAWMADEAARERFQSLPLLKTFAEGLKARAEEGPTATRVERVAASEG